MFSAWKGGCYVPNSPLGEYSKDWVQDRRFDRLKRSVHKIADQANNIFVAM